MARRWEEGVLYRRGGTPVLMVEVEDIRDLIRVFSVLRSVKAVVSGVDRSLAPRQSSFRDRQALFTYSQPGY